MLAPCSGVAEFGKHCTATNVLKLDDETAATFSDYRWKGVALVGLGWMGWPLFEARWIHHERVRECIARRFEGLLSASCGYEKGSRVGNYSRSSKTHQVLMESSREVSVFLTRYSGR